MSDGEEPGGEIKDGVKKHPPLSSQPPIPTTLSDSKSKLLKSELFLFSLLIRVASFRGPQFQERISTAYWDRLSGLAHSLHPLH